MATRPRIRLWQHYHIGGQLREGGGGADRDTTRAALQQEGQLPLRPPSMRHASTFDADWAHHPLGRHTWPSAQIRPVREIALRYSEVCCWGVSRP